MTRRAHSLNDARWISRLPDRTRRAHVHRTMRFGATIEVVTLNRSRETAPLRLAHHVDDVAVGKLIDENLVADIRAFIRCGQTKLFQDPRRRDAGAGLFKVSAHGLIHVFQLDRTIFDEPDLHRVVTILAAGGFLLHYYAGPGFDDCHRSDRTVRREQLRHANFLADD